MQGRGGGAQAGPHIVAWSHLQHSGRSHGVPIEDPACRGVSGSPSSFPPDPTTPVPGIPPSPPPHTRTLLCGLQARRRPWPAHCVVPRPRHPQQRAHKVGLRQGGARRADPRQWPCFQQLPDHGGWVEPTTGRWGAELDREECGCPHTARTLRGSAVMCDALCPRGADLLCTSGSVLPPTARRWGVVWHDPLESPEAASRV